MMMRLHTLYQTLKLSALYSRLSVKISRLSVKMAEFNVNICLYKSYMHIVFQFIVAPFRVLFQGYVCLLI
jgi:hypothetical protein